MKKVNVEKVIASAKEKLLDERTDRAEAVFKVQLRDIDRAKLIVRNLKKELDSLKASIDDLVV